MADKTLSQLPNAEGVNLTDLFLLSQGTSVQGFDSKKLAASVLAVWLANSMEFTQQLETDSKTIVGAINELYEGGTGGGGRLDIEYDSVEEIFNVTSDEIVEALENGFMLTFSSDETADDFLYTLNSVYPDGDEIVLFFNRFWTMGNGSGNSLNADFFQCLVTVDTANDTVTFGGYSEVPNVLTTRDNATTQFNNWSASKIDTAIKQAVWNVLPTRSASGSIASFTDGADNVPIVDGVFNIEAIQSGSGDPSPSNVRPISGFTGANVTRCGKNLFDKNTSSNWVNWGILSGGVISENSAFKSAILRCSPNTLFTASKTLGTRIGLASFTSYPTTSSIPSVFDFNNTGSQISITTGANDKYILVWFRNGNVDTATSQEIANTLQVEKGSVTTYEAYQGVTKLVTWQTEAGTVYGGELDVVNGVLKNVYKHKTIETISAWSGSSTSFYYWASSISDMKSEGSYIDDIYSDVLKRINTLNEPFGIYRVGHSYVITVPKTYTIEEYNDHIAGHDLYYPLETPVEIALTPEQINTLYGTNNIWADTGDVTVEYRADVQLYIDKKIAEDVGGNRSLSLSKAPEEVKEEESEEKEEKTEEGGNNER